MNPIVTPDIKEVMEATHYRPAISLILPVDTKFSLKNELPHTLKLAADKIEQLLSLNYSNELTTLVMLKLRAAIRRLDLNAVRKSIAFFISPVFEKVLHLDIHVEEKMIIDESFEIRDLVYSNKQVHKYLLLILSNKESRIFLGNSGNLMRLIPENPESIFAYVNDIAEKVANFSDMSERKEVMMEKFVHHVDESLGMILKSYPLPVFVAAPERVLGRFREFTRHKEAVVSYINGNYDDTPMNDLRKILEPELQRLQKQMQAQTLSKLEEAASQNKLVYGIQDVWHESMINKGRLLVVEKDYMVAARHGADGSIIYETRVSDSAYSVIRDAVDDVIEKVLNTGGDVEFVDNGMLQIFKRIALVEYY